MKSRLDLIERTQWDISSQIDETQSQLIIQAIEHIDRWLGTPGLLSLFLRQFGPVRITPSSLFWQKLGFHHVFLSTIFLDPRHLTVHTAVHEISHLLDNLMGCHPLAVIFGGGPSDDMLRFIGLEPDQFFPRFHFPNYEDTLKSNNIELNPTIYGRTNGPAEDFAETFRLAVMEPDHLRLAAPLRYRWINTWKAERLGFQYKSGKPHENQLITIDISYREN